MTGAATRRSGRLRRPVLDAWLRWPRLLVPLLVLVLLAGGVLVRAFASDDSTSSTVRPESLTIAVGPESDGSKVKLDADLYLPAGSSPAPAVLLTHGFGGSKSDLTDQAQQLVDAGYVVLAYTARGFAGSGGRVHLADPDFEVADASRLIDLLSTRRDVLQDGPGDPRVATMGGSYGGAVALMAGGTDPRIDSVVALITWHDLASAFYPQHARGAATAEPGPFLQLWAASFFSSVALAGGPDASGDGDPRCGRFDPQVCRMFLDAAQTGRPDPQLLELLRRNSPAPTLGTLRAPTFLVQGMADSLFGIEQADATAAALQASGTPVAVRWFNGGHDGAGPVGAAAQRVGGPAQDGAPQGGLAGSAASAATQAAETERDQQEEQIRAWLDWSLRRPADVRVDNLPIPGFSYAMPLRRGDDAAHVSMLPAYQPLRSTGPQTIRDLPLHPAASSAGGRLLNPPGGAPASVTVVPGVGGLLGAAPSYPLAALPGQHVAFDTDPLTEAVQVVGAPRVSFELTSSGSTATVFVSLWQLQGSNATLPRRLVAPVRVATTPGVAQRLDVDLPMATWDLPEGSSWRVLVTATDTAYRNDPVARVDEISLAEPALHLPVGTGTAVAGPGIWDTEAVVVGSALAALVLGWWLRHLVVQRRRHRDEADLSDVSEIPLTVSGLVKEYADGHRAVDNVSWRAEPGQVVGLLGPNGAGKTTTLRMVLGLIHPDAGSVHVLGQPVRPGSPVLSRVGAMVEGPGFLPHLTGRANLRAHWAATGRPMEQAEFQEVLQVAALGDAIDRPVRSYSHGMKQRLGIAQAMLGLPEVLVLDEPTNGLDPPQIAAMRPILQRYAAAGRTVVLSSHLLGEVEQTCSHVVVMHAGRVVAQGSVAEVGVSQGHSLEEVFLATIAGAGRDHRDGRGASRGASPGEDEDRLRQVRKR